MEYKILTNRDKSNIKQRFIKYGKKADKIKIATAFFSEDNLIKDWISSGKKIELLVSLRPPTNYYLLDEIISQVKVYNVGKNFHSKFYIFFRKDKPFAGIIGSSNFTNGGLVSNIETNYITEEEDFIKEMDIQFNKMSHKVKRLNKPELDDYKSTFDKYQLWIKQIEKELSDHNKKYNKGNKKQKSYQEIITDYKAYCELINKIKSYVKDISDEEFPEIPTNIVIDHYWHWVKEVWDKNGINEITQSNRRDFIKKLFTSYCRWDKEKDNYTNNMFSKHKEIFSKLLSLNNIDKITEQDIFKIYVNTHAGNTKINEMHMPQNKLRKDNSVEKVRKSLKYLLYSEDDITIRINNLLNRNSEYNLKHFGPSIIQELIGWVNPYEYPLRNDKADKALRLLGYDL